MKKLKSLFKNPFFNLVLIGLITFLVYKNLIGSQYEIVIQSLSTSNFVYLVLAIIIQFSTLFLAGYVLMKIGHLFELKMSFPLAVSASFVGILGSGIFPMGSGAQLFQFYVFNKESMDNSKVIAMLWIEFVLYQSALVVVSLILILTNISTLINSGYLIGVGIGFLMTSFVLIGLTLLSFSEGFYKFIIKSIGRIYKLLKLKGDVSQIEQSLYQQVSQFKETLDLFKSNTSLILRLLCLNILRLILFLSVSFFVAKALGIPHLPYWSLLGAHIFVLMHNSFIPIPGQSGTTEYFFQQFFTPYYSSQTTQVLIVWRFIQYYLTMIVGAIILMVYKMKPRRIS